MDDPGLDEEMEENSEGKKSGGDPVAGAGEEKASEAVELSDGTLGQMELSAEAKSLKCDKLEEIIKQQRAERQEQERREELEREKSRRKTGQEIVNARERMEEMKILAEQTRREKLEAKLASFRQPQKHVISLFVIVILTLSGMIPFATSASDELMTTSKQSMFKRMKIEATTNEEKVLNLKKLFTRIDLNQDRCLDFTEINIWIRLLENETLFHDILHFFEAVNLPANELLSWDQLINIYGITSNSITKANEPEITLHRHRWNLADEDKDGKLNFEELKGFIAPEKSEKAGALLLYKTMSYFDLNADGKISPQEFSQILLGTTSRISTWELYVAEMFTFNDIDGDDLLDQTEMLAWLKFVSIHRYEVEISHLMDEADTDEDGKICPGEIMNALDILYHSSLTDYGLFFEDNYQK